MTSHNERMTIPKPQRLQCVNDERTRQPACSLAHGPIYLNHPAVRHDGAWSWGPALHCPECGAELAIVSGEQPQQEGAPAEVVDPDAASDDGGTDGLMVELDLPDGIPMGQVVITKIVTDDDVQVSMRYSDDLPVVELLGMLEMTKDAVLHPEDE